MAIVLSIIIVAAAAFVGLVSMVSVFNDSFELFTG